VSLIRLSLALPALFSIGLAAPWLAASVPSQGPAVVVTVVPERTFQTIRGWGADFSLNRNLNFVSQATVEQLIEEAVNDLGLTFLRIGFGYLHEPYNDNSNPREIDWSRFMNKGSIDREGARGLRAFVQRVEANGEVPTFLLNREWEDSAPSWMNDAEFAETVAATILYYKNQLGVDITFTSVENEPMKHDSYTPAKHRGIIKAMGPAFEAFGLSTKVALNEGIDARSTWEYIDALRGDRTLWRYIGLLNWHLYGTNDPYRSQIRDFGMARGIPTAQTEFPAHVYNLADDLTLGGVSYWTRYHLANMGRSESDPSKGGSFWMNLDGTSFGRNDTYWKVRQFMRYVRPGAIRTEATSTSRDVRALAFAGPRGQTVVILNPRSENVTVRVQGLTPDRYAVSHAQWIIYKELGVHTVEPSGSLDVSVPADGVLTVHRYPGVNQSPVVTSWTATPSFLTLPAATGLALSSSAQDVELDALTFAWSVTRQPAGADVSLSSPARGETQATGLTRAGEYVFTVVVRDSAGGSTSRDVTVRAYDGNQPPVIAEGHRFFKDGWMVQPGSTNTYGPLFISAFDLEGDPVTTSFSVVSQPPRADAKFKGANVSGMTVPGTYVFRFTASDGTRSVSREFKQVVVPRREAR
jgi:O-glycosyl hydrolase